MGFEIGTKRHPRVEYRRVPLSEEQHHRQIKSGLYVVDNGGERLAVPVDGRSDPTYFLDRSLWRHDDEHGTYRPGVKFGPPVSEWQGKTLAWLRDNVHRSIPERWYYLTLGHDLHVSMRGDLDAIHWHPGWVDPFTHEQAPPLDTAFATLRDTHWLDHECHRASCPAEAVPDWDVMLGLLGGLRGFTENLGWLSGALLTTAFDSEIIDELFVNTSSEFADFDFHEVGTSAAGEANTEVALAATSGIARATGSPTDSDPVYENDATITADATETWEEHGIFNNAASVAMMDRNVTGGQAVNSSDQVTYQFDLTLTPES